MKPSEAPDIQGNLPGLERRVEELRASLSLR